MLLQQHMPAWDAAELDACFAGCTKLPSFNFPGQTPASRCGTHREEGMVNVRHRVCQHEGERLSPHLLTNHGCFGQASEGLQDHQMARSLKTTKVAREESQFLKGVICGS